MIFKKKNDHKIKRVCLICEFPPPPGGMAQQANLLFDLLISENVNVKKCDTNIRMPIFFHNLEKKLLFKILVKLPMLLWRMFLNIKSCDVVHVFSIAGVGFFVITAPAVLISRFFRKRVIVNYHAGYFKDFYDNYNKRLINFILKRADCITTPLDYLKNEFQYAGFGIKEIPNIVDLKRFHFRHREFFKPKFIVTRHLRSVYGVDVVIKAFAKIINRYPNATLIVAGDGNRMKELRELASKLNIESNIEFTGYLEKEDLVQIYEKSDIFLNGSRRDNMPISILESYAAGLPVVTTNPMGIPHFVKHGVTGLLVEIDDHDELAKSALSILDNPIIGRDLVNNAKCYADSLMWDSVKPRVFAAYGIDFPG
ncbi:MAG: glycosyltransferase family 4 protein [Pseudomonadota bacterium]